MNQNNSFESAEVEQAVLRLTRMKEMIREASELPFFSRKVQKRINEALETARVVTDEEFRQYLQHAFVEGSNIESPEAQAQLNAFFNHSQAILLPVSPDSTAIIFKASYLNSEAGSFLGFDLLAEEIGHSLKSKKEVRRLKEVFDRSILSRLYKTPEDLTIQLKNAIEKLQIQAEVPSAENLMIQTEGFSIYYLSDKGEILPKDTTFVVLEEMRASIIQLVLEIAYYGREATASKGRTTNHFRTFTQGVDVISKRFRVAPEDYANEAKALTFVVSYLYGLEGKDVIESLEVLITNLTRMDYDRFYAWLEETKPHALRAFDNLFIQMVLYKKSLIDGSGLKSEG